MDQLSLFPEKKENKACLAFLPEGTKFLGKDLFVMEVFRQGLFTEPISGKELYQTMAFYQGYTRSFWVTIHNSAKIVTVIN